MNAILPDRIIERRWLTYAEAAIFILPAVIAGAFACTFLVPKVKEIIHMAELDPRQYGWVYSATFFLIHWWGVLLAAGILTFVLLDFAAPRWWRRQLAVGIGIWLANVTVFLALTMLLIIVLMAAPGLAHAR